MATILDTFIRSIIFHRPKRATYTTSTRPGALLHIPRVSPLDYKENGTFTCAYFIAPPDPIKPCHLLLYAHPNAVDIGMAYDELKEVAALAHVYVLLFEYTGYGIVRDEEASEASTHIDMLSAHCFARRYLGVPADRIIVCGRSIGSAPAARLCATLPASETPCLLILQCPFVALSDCIQQFSNNAVSIANFFGYNWFRTVDIIEHVRTPVVLHHGTRDESVPIKHSYALKKRRDEAARPCVTYLYQEEGAGHNNLSRRVLARIIHEKVETATLEPLALPWPTRYVAHPSQFWFFFAEDGVNTLAAAQAVWRQQHKLGDFLFQRERLSALLTLSCCVFAMSCARAWQVLQLQTRTEAFKAAANAGMAAPRTKEELIECALACWGSPLGIHLTIPNASTDVSEAVIFGARTACSISECGFAVPLETCRYPTEALLTVAELFITSGLVEAMQRAVATAPNLLTKEDSGAPGSSGRPTDTLSPQYSTTDSDTPTTSARASRQMPSLGPGTSRSSLSSSFLGAASTPVPQESSDDGEASLVAWSYPDMTLYLQADVVERIQTECERVVSFVPEDEWDALQTLLRHLRSTSAALLSDKARALCFAGPSQPVAAGASSRSPAPAAQSDAAVDSGNSGSSSSGSTWRRRAEEASLEELEEWLRPWVDRVRPPLASLVAEVPWDYYLFRGRRVLQKRRGAACDTPQAAVTWVQEREMVSTLYYLFTEYSHRCVKPSFCL